MRIETKSKILKILFFISLIICLFLINATYARYVEQMDTKYNSSAKRWKVVLNNKVIREETTLSNVLTPTLEQNELFAEDIIAPGREGYFDMEIDFSTVDVPFTLDFSVEQNADDDGGYNNLPDFKYYGYTLEEKNIIYYNLPEEYKQLDFIESTGSQYIDTLAKGSNVSKVEIKRVYDSESAPEYRVVTHNNDDERNIVLFGEYQDELSEDIQCYETDKIYGCKIYMNNIIIRELVPCYKIEDNAKGLYDMVTGQFLENLGEGQFSNASKEIEPCVIDPESIDFVDNKAHSKAYIRWNEGEGTEESLEDVLDNLEDTKFVKSAENVDVKYKATVIFKQYIGN